MINQIEKEVENAVCKYAKSNYGWAYRKQHGQGDKGKADRYFINSGGRIVFVEFKKPGKKLTPLQEREIRLLRGKGFIAVAIDSIESGEWFFDGLRSGAIYPEIIYDKPLMVGDWSI